MRVPRLGLLCGLIAPLLWAGAIAFCATLRPGYSHVTQYISELGEAGSRTRSIVTYAGFVPTGLMHMAFACALFKVFQGNRLASIAAALIAVNGLARIGAGLFPCDPACVPTGSLDQRMHSAFALVGFFALIAASALWGAVFRGFSQFRVLSVYSWLSAAAAAVFLASMRWTAAPNAAVGLYERLASGALSLWILVLAATLLRLHRRDRNT
jgi:hypothetical membrane protein